MRQVEHDGIKLRIGDMLFTWDDEKERINFRKHKVHFAVAASAFTDSYLLVENNSVDDYTGGERIGSVGGRELLFVVYVERVTLNNDEIIRIISARKCRGRNRLSRFKPLKPRLDTVREHNRERMQKAGTVQ